MYNPNSSEDDKDLAFLILQYGGPGLLHIVNRAIKFPCTSRAYKLLKTKGLVVQSAIDTPFERFIGNVCVKKENPKHGCMLKIEETYHESKVQWNINDNKMYGLCYEQTATKNLTVNS